MPATFADSIPEGLQRCVRQLEPGSAGDIVGNRRVAWGDSGATTGLTLRSGRRLAARRYVGSHAVLAAETIVRRARRLAEHGRRVPAPAGVVRDGSAAWLLTTWVEGPTGAAALDEPQMTIALASAMGRLASELPGVDPSGLRPATTWADVERLSETMTTALDAVRARLAPAERATLETDVRRVVSAWTDHAETEEPGGWSSPWRVGLAHGDFAPINVLRPDGGPPVLLDLDDLCLAPRILDPAWWGWVVRYHHPAAWAIGMPHLLEAAGLSDANASEGSAAAPVDGALLTSVGRLRCLERTANAADPDARDRWVDRLRGSAGW